MKRLIVLLSLALLVAACSGKSATTAANAVTANGLTVSAAFSPDPPKQGSETITVTVKDAASGQPVTGAKVLIATNMPSMAMAGPTLSAQDNGDGTYAALANLNYGTTWNFTINVAENGKTASLKSSQEVK